MEAREMTEKAQEWQEKAKDVAGQAQEWQQRAAETARNTGRAIHEYVNDNAWTSVAIAAAIGCAIGLLIGRSSD